MQDKVEQLEENLKNKEGDMGKQLSENEQLKQDIDKCYSAVNEMIADAVKARDSAPLQEDLRDDFDRMVAKVVKMPDVSGREITTFSESVVKDLQVWHDRQLE